MEELAKVVELVKLLQQTVEAQIQRVDQVFKTQDERWTAQAAKFDELVTTMQTGIDQLTIMDEALKRSLSESDQALDDMSDLVAALLMLKTEQQQEQQQQQQTATA